MGTYRHASPFVPGAGKVPPLLAGRDRHKHQLRRRRRRSVCGAGGRGVCQRQSVVWPGRRYRREPPPRSRDWPRAQRLRVAGAAAPGRSPRAQRAMEPRHPVHDAVCAGSGAQRGGSEPVVNAGKEANRRHRFPVRFDHAARPLRTRNRSCQELVANALKDTGLSCGFVQFINDTLADLPVHKDFEPMQA